MIAAECQDRPSYTMDRGSAVAMTQLVVEALESGICGVRAADGAVAALERDGFRDLADVVRAAVAARRGVLRCRGFRAVR